MIRGLAAGESVEIDGLGVFYPDAVRVFRFEPRSLPKVFIAYVKEDRAIAERLYTDRSRRSAAYPKLLGQSFGNLRFSHPV